MANSPSVRIKVRAVRKLVIQVIMCKRHEKEQSGAWSGTVT